MIITQEAVSPSSKKVHGKNWCLFESKKYTREILVGELLLRHTKFGLDNVSCGPNIRPKGQMEE